MDGFDETPLDSGGYPAHAELADRQAVGDPAAAWGILERFARDIYDFIACTTWDFGAAEELTRQTIERAQVEPYPRGQVRSLRAWLFGIACSAAADLQRDRPRSPSETSQPEEWRSAAVEFAANFAITDGSGVFDDAPEPDDPASVVWTAAASLDGRAFALLDLAYRKHLGTRELAEALHLSSAQAVVDLHRAKEELAGASKDLLAMRMSYICTSLAALVPPGSRELRPAHRTSIDEHFRRCGICGPQAQLMAHPELLLSSIPPFELPESLGGPPSAAPGEPGDAEVATAIALAAADGAAGVDADREHDVLTAPVAALSTTEGSPPPGSMPQGSPAAFQDLHSRRRRSSRRLREVRQREGLAPVPVASRRGRLSSFRGVAALVTAIAVIIAGGSMMIVFVSRPVASRPQATSGTTAGTTGATTLTSPTTSATPASPTTAGRTTTTAVHRHIASTRNKQGKTQAPPTTARRSTGTTTGSTTTGSVPTTTTQPTTTTTGQPPPGPPSVDSMSPASGYPSSSTVSIAGQFLSTSGSPPPVVQFEEPGQEVQGTVTSWSANSISVIVPSQLLSGSANLVVTARSQTMNVPGSFDVLPYFSGNYDGQQETLSLPAAGAGEGAAVSGLLTNFSTDVSQYLCLEGQDLGVYVNSGNPSQLLAVPPSDSCDSQSFVFPRY